MNHSITTGEEKNFMFHFSADAIIAMQHSLSDHNAVEESGNSS
jgi:hypothetical protein